jgi:hypothetical protein
MSWIGASVNSVPRKDCRSGRDIGRQRFEAGRRIDVSACTNPMLPWNGEMIDTTLAIEQYFIDRLQPIWNTMHRKRAGKTARAAASCLAAGTKP